MYIHIVHTYIHTYIQDLHLLKYTYLPYIITYNILHTYIHIFIHTYRTYIHIYMLPKLNYY